MELFAAAIVRIDAIDGQENTLGGRVVLDMDSNEFIMLFAALENLIDIHAKECDCDVLREAARMQREMSAIADALGILE